MTQHQLKTWPASFHAIVHGDKRAEFRQEDGRTFLVGDVVLLNEWDPVIQKYTGRSQVTLITDVQRGPSWGIPVGYAMLTLKVSSSD